MTMVYSQVIEKCRENEYPPPLNDQIQTETVNLDLPAKERWAHIILPRKQKILDFMNYAKSLLPLPLRLIAQNILANGIDKLPNNYREEIVGIGEALEIPLGEIFAGNIFYELEKLCTSIITQDAEGNIYHGRNLDLGALLGWDDKKKTWKIAELLRPLAINVEYKSGGRVLYKSVQFAGSIGVFTGVAPGRFSISLNSRSPAHRFGGPMSIISWLYFSNTKARFASFWARTVLETAKDYDSALEMLSTQPLLAPVYYIIGGAKPRQGAVVTRSKSESVHPASFAINSNEWYLIQTNYDSWKDAPFYDNRRTPSKICLNTLYNSVSNEGNQYKMLYNVLSTIPVLNKATIYTTLMSASDGHLESYRRNCPGLCYPW